MVTSSEEASVENLALMRFYLKNAPSEIKDWSRGANVPYIDPCLYFLLYGRQGDFKSFPHPDNEVNAFAFSVKEGLDAYRYLLQTVSGYRSRNKGETHSRRQFYDGWRKFQEDNPDTARHYQGFVAGVKDDVSYLQDVVAIDLQKTKHEIVARDLSGQVKGEKILIVGSVKKDKIGDYTKSMISISENKQDPSGKKRKGKNFICITHPDPKALDVLKGQIEELEQKKRIGSNIEFFEFGALGAHMEQSDRVYVDLPMGDDPQADAKMVDAWVSKKRKDNVLTHMRGVPKKLMESTDLWLGACIRDDCVLPEDIVDEIGRRSKINKRIVRAVFGTSQRISELRFGGIQNPSDTIEQEQREAEYPLETQLHFD